MITLTSLLLATAIHTASSCPPMNLPPGLKPAREVKLKIYPTYRTMIISNPTYDKIFAFYDGTPAPFPGNGLTRILEFGRDEIVILPFMLPNDKEYFSIEYAFAPDARIDSAPLIPNVFISECPGTFIVDSRCVHLARNSGKLSTVVAENAIVEWNLQTCPIKKNKVYYLHFTYHAIKYKSVENQFDLLPIVEREYGIPTSNPASICYRDQCGFLMAGYFHELTERIIQDHRTRDAFYRAVGTNISPPREVYVNLLTGETYSSAEQAYAASKQVAQSSKSKAPSASSRATPAIPEISFADPALTKDRAALIESLNTAAKAAENFAVQTGQLPVSPSPIEHGPRNAPTMPDAHLHSIRDSNTGRSSIKYEIE